MGKKGKSKVFVESKVVAVQGSSELEHVANHVALKYD